MTSGGLLVGLISDQKPGAKLQLVGKIFMMAERPDLQCF
jgi:hypothetical protein